MNVHSDQAQFACSRTIYVCKFRGFGHQTERENEWMVDRRKTNSHATLYLLIPDDPYIPITEQLMSEKLCQTFLSNITETLNMIISAHWDLLG